MTEPLLTNERAKREWAWIVKHVGEAAALAALERLGNHRPYPLNVARALGLRMPLELAEPPRHRRDCTDLRRILKQPAG